MTWSLEKIYNRCVPDDGCMLWQGAMAADRYPIAQEPAPDKPHGQRQVHVRRKVFELARGTPAPAGPRYVLVATCDKARCVAEGCVQLQTKGARLRQAVKAGAFKSPAFRAKVAAGRRRDSDLSDDDVAAILASDEPVRVLADRYGISLGYAYAVQRGKNRRDYSSPFAALVPLPDRS